MSPALETFILENTGASKTRGFEEVQHLWSGYGQLLRVKLAGYSAPSVIVKHIKWPSKAQHLRGWSGGRSDRRKKKSYQVEMQWYRHYSDQCSAGCRVPGWLASAERKGESFILLEDLNPAGFNLRRSAASHNDLAACIDWLAHFHASFLVDRDRTEITAPGLWPTGTYWHLATRPDELAAVDDADIRRAAPLVDQKLMHCRFQTLVHGDAKLANFCFSPAGGVAAVDFQYVGIGCGMKDLAYLVSSCLDEKQCARQEGQLLKTYFTCLEHALKGQAIDFSALEGEWRELYPYAWADFCRFLLGWSPGHFKLHGYSLQLTRQVLDQVL